MKRQQKIKMDTRALLLRARTPPRVAIGDTRSPVSVADNQAGEEGSAAKRVASVMRDSSSEDIGNVILRGRLCLRALKLVLLPDGFGCTGSDGLDYGRLVHLDVSENSLRELPSRFGTNLNSLEFLDASNNCLKGLPSSIGRMVNLRTLYLQNNELRSVPYDIGSCSALRVLRLENNVFSQLPKSIGKLQYLRVLHIYNLPALAKIPDEIGNLKMLQELLMDSTPNVVQLPQTMGQLHASGDGSLLIFSCGDLSRFENIPESWYAGVDESYAPLKILEGLYYSDRLKRKRRTAFVFGGLSTVLLMWLRSIAEPQLLSYPQFVTMNRRKREQFISTLFNVGHSSILSVFTIFSFLFNGKAMKLLQTGEVSWAPAMNSVSLAFIIVDTLNRMRRNGLDTRFVLRSVTSVVSILYVLYTGYYESLLCYWHAGQWVEFFSHVQIFLRQLGLNETSPQLFRQNGIALAISYVMTKIIHALLAYRSLSLLSYFKGSSNAQSSNTIGTIVLSGSTFSILTAFPLFRQYIPFL
jgi:hypothetical protein